MFPGPLRLTKPGLFVTGTDTGVGKTVITCGIAAALRRQMAADEAAGPAAVRVGVCKPFATGCRHEREGLVSEDAEALAHFADCRQPLAVINPIRFAPPVAPAVAAQLTGQRADLGALARALHVLDRDSDALLIEGVGGLLVPLDGDDPQVTMLDLALALRYPVVVVARAGLGTLSHTAMTVRLLRDAGCPIAGLVINGYEPDVAKSSDPAMPYNRPWLEKMNGVPVLATVPVCPAGEVAPQRGRIPPAILEAVALTYWPEVIGRPGSRR